MGTHEPGRKKEEETIYDSLYAEIFVISATIKKNTTL